MSLKRRNPYRHEGTVATKFMRTGAPVRGAIGSKVLNVIAKTAAAASSRAGRLRRRNNATMGFLGIERKFYDTALALTAIPAPTDSSGGEMDPSATSMISTPAQGDTEQNRDGKKINIIQVAIDGVIQVSPAELQAGPQRGTKVYVALVLDTQSNGAQMNSEDCFKNTNAAAATSIVPQRNLLFGTRFRILREMVIDVTPVALSHFAVDSFSYSGQIKPFHIFRKFPGGLPVNFNAGTTASIANVIDNSLHVIAYTNDTTVIPQLAYNARIRFVG